MTATALQWSDLARNPRRIAEIVDRDGEARIERRGHEQLVLLEARRYDTAVEHLETLTRLVRSLLLTRSIEVAVKETFPWTGALPSDGREEFFAEFVETFEVCKDLDVWVPLERLLVEWRATATIHADPELREALRRPMIVDEELGPVPPPEVPDAEAG
ncbi:MAG: hypothetical protein ACRDT2_09710 [Natronosporangium sp.]